MVLRNVRGPKSTIDQSGPQGTDKDHEDAGMKNNIRNKFEKIFSDQETPTYASMREMEAMKARLNELETELARQSESQQADSKTADQELVTVLLQMH